MNESARRERDPFAMWAGWLLLAVAFAGSYMHVVAAVAAWGQEGWMSYAIAAMPEVTVLIGMRKVLTNAMTSIMWVFLATAGMFTLGGNLNSAQHTIGGYIAAGWPAWSAIGALIFAGVHAHDEAASQTRTATEVTFRRGSTKTTTKTHGPVTMTPVRHPGPIVDHDPEPSRDLVVVSPEVKAATPRALGAQGQPDPVMTSLLAEWSPGQVLTKEIKASVVKATGVSESTVKRTANKVLTARMGVRS